VIVRTSVALSSGMLSGAIDVIFDEVIVRTRIDTPGKYSSSDRTRGVQSLQTQQCLVDNIFATGIKTYKSSLVRRNT
jgi:hypothetical protein